MKLYRVISLFIISFLLTYVGVAQDVMSGCVSIDFEAINGEPVFDGMVVSDQYFENFGLTFSLEDGTSPLIAQVGPPTTAFGGPGGGFNGSDTPAPGVNIGQFFLTDDGVLGGLTSPALILDFVNPLDSIAGCILDIDFDETFIMHARDIDGNVLLADTIRAGDPGTGDGALSCWGFNLEGCEGAIYSLRMEGTRESPGAFGLGVDFLSFCLSGIDLVNNIVPIVQNTFCDLENGSITLTNQVGTPLTYSIDGINFQESNVFENLGPGAYTIFVMNEEGCTGQIDLPILVDVPLNTDDLVIEQTTCGESNGSLFVLSNGESGNLYSLDGINYQEGQLFSDLSPGDYTLTKVDQYGCDYFESFTIAPSLLPSLDLVTAVDEYCSLSDGIIEVAGTPSSGVASYSLNGSEYQEQSIFEELSAGNYTVSMTDSDSCILTLNIMLDNIGNVLIEEVTITEPTCEVREGSISIIASGGIGELQYTIDEGEYQDIGLFESVEPGMHTITVQDATGCNINETIEIAVPDCPVFIPNIFCPSCGDGENAVFTINTTRLYDVQILDFEIYDRWGNLIFKSGNDSVRNGSIFWDGTFDGIAAEIGVYAYRINILHENGQEDVLHGDITLLR